MKIVRIDIVSLQKVTEETHNDRQIFTHSIFETILQVSMKSENGSTLKVVHRINFGLYSLNLNHTLHESKV